MKYRWLILLGLLAVWLAGCQPENQGTPAAAGGLKVLAVETYLADITRNVAGERAQVTALIPLGLDPHAFEPAPQDVAKITASQVLVVNGAGFEAWLGSVLVNAGGQRRLVEASAGLKSRSAREGEAVEGVSGHNEASQGDPHFWLDPLSVVQYVENIRAGLAEVDPAGSEVYARNAAEYTARLKELDAWIRVQLQALPPERRLLVTNHESLGYFADRYGFKVVGTILPSVSTEAAPSAQELARLVDQIRAVGARAIFLETGSNTQLARQVAQETGVKVVSDLYTHSVTAPGGPAPTYIDMMKANVTAIVTVLK